MSIRIQLSSYILKLLLSHSSNNPVTWGSQSSSKGGHLVILQTHLAHPRSSRKSGSERQRDLYKRAVLYIMKVTSIG